MISMDLSKIEYTTHTEKWFAERFPNLPDEVHWAMYLASQGVMPKQAKALTKKLKRKSTLL